MNTAGGYSQSFIVHAPVGSRKIHQSSRGSLLHTSETSKNLGHQLTSVCTRSVIKIHIRVLFSCVSFLEVNIFKEISPSSVQITYLPFPTHKTIPPQPPLLHYTNNYKVTCKKNV